MGTVSYFCQYLFMAGVDQPPIFLSQVIMKRVHLPTAITFLKQVAWDTVVPIKEGATPFLASQGGPIDVGGFGEEP